LGGPPEQPADAEADDDDAHADLAAHWAMVTDIALTTLSGPDGLHVLARSLATAMPLPGLGLALHSLGQEVLDQQTTDAHGEALFAPGLLRGQGAASPEVLSAAGNGDFAMLSLARPAFDFSDRGASGLLAPGAVQAFVALDRDIFRPGETVNVTALLRDGSGLAAADMPLTLALLRPDGVEARQVSLGAGLAGGFHEAFVLTRSAARGHWTIEARLDPKGKAISSVQFDVQDFVPQQLKVSLASTSRDLAPGRPIDVTLNGQFLYGAPAAGLHGEAELSIQRDPSPVPEAADYQFGLVTDETPPTVQKLELPDADDAGNSHIATALDPLPATSVPLKGVLTAGLFEPSGRVVDEHLELPIRNQPLLIGLRSTGATQGDATQQVAFDVRTFTGDARPAARTGLQWRIVREDVRYDWVRSGARWTYHRHVLDVPVSSGSLDVPEAAPGHVTAALPWGTYRLVVSDAASGAASSVRLGVGWSVVSTDDDTPDKVAVTTDTPVVTAGQDVRLHIDAPFAGLAQVTVMGSRIFEARNIPVATQGADLVIKAQADWGQGAYVMVDVVRPLREVHGHAPVRAVGLAWIGLDQAAHTLDVRLDAPERMVPRQPLRIPVHVGGGVAGKPAWVSLAAVDEGILQLTRFETPDPAAFLFGKRQLGFDMRDDYGHLLDGNAAGGQVREGGDEGKSIGGASLAVTSTKIVSLFSGPVALDADGNGVVTLEVPDFEGQLRLMALAWSRQGVGKAEGRVTVRDPVLADLSLPRFLAPGDDAVLAVSVANTDGAEGDYRMELASGGAAQLSNDHPLQWHLKQGDRQQDRIGIRGLSEGVATLGVDLAGPAGYHLHRDWQIVVRSPHYPVTLEQTAVQNPGDTFRLDPRVVDTFSPGGFTVSVGYSGLAGIDAPSLLQSLYRYPYGCTEQLASSAWPLIYFNDPKLLGSLPRDEKTGARVQAAVDSIVDREDAGGRFGLWQTNDGLASAWLNAYVLDFLLHARDAGFDVPDEALQRSRRWIQQRVRGSGGNDDGTSYAEGEANSRAYGEYVLARMGQGDIAALRRDRDALSAQAGSPYTFWSLVAAKDAVAAPLALAELAGSLSLMGDKPGAEATFAHALSNLALQARLWPAWWFTYDYGSPVRDLAQMGAIAADSGNDALAHTIVQRIAGLNLKSEGLNTQEKAALLSAAHAMSRDDAARRLKVDGIDGPLSLPAEFAPDPSRVAAGFETVNTGTKTLWRTLSVHGAPRDALPPLSHGYTLHREYLGLDGKPVDPGKTRQNDRLIVALHGQMTDEADRRTVLVEMLPAGWEIETVIRTAGKDGPYAFLAPLSDSRVEEARDDRFVAAFDLDGVGGVFGAAATDAEAASDSPGTAPTLPADQFHVAYLVRVVTPGHFALPEAEVEDMYRPEVMARTGAGAIGVAPR
ncbi:MAG: alpha-2-macroglobulin family protein, partial [Janthinobacterium lividum]